MHCTVLDWLKVDYSRLYDTVAAEPALRLRPTQNCWRARALGAARGVLWEADWEVGIEVEMRASYSKPQYIIYTTYCTTQFLEYGRTDVLYRTV